MEPVLIAGGGPVGLGAALLLARWGIPSVVLEAAERWSPGGSRALCFQRDVLDVFDRIGCADEMLAEGVTWATSRTFYRDHELFTVTFPDPGASVLPPWINISQTSVERLLLARARAEPLIDLRPGHQVTGLTADCDGVTLHAEPAATGAPRGARAPRGADQAARAGDAAATFRGSHVIGADGSRSAVRQLLGIDFPGRSYPDQFLICDIKADLPFPSERRFFFDPAWNPGRQVLVHQCPDGVWRIDWQVPADFDLAAERAGGGLDARIRQVTGGVPYELVWATAYRFHERVAGSFAAGRAFLAGDAAHLYAPFGARGLNSGMQDAENLAWKLAFVRHGWAPRGLLGSYHAERHAAARENLRVTSATMEFLVPQTDESRRRRTEVLDAAMTDPQARVLVNSGKLAEPYWYTASPLTTPGQALADFPVTPGVLRPPVPGVLCPDGPVSAGGPPTRLRRLLGHGFVLLTQTRQGAALAGQAARAVCTAPVASYALDDIDMQGALWPALAATSASVHIVRPDGHLAAVLPAGEPDAIAAAVLRSLGRERH